MTTDTQETIKRICIKHRWPYPPEEGHWLTIAQRCKAELIANANTQEHDENLIRATIYSLKMHIETNPKEDETYHKLEELRLRLFFLDKHKTAPEDLSVDKAIQIANEEIAKNNIDIEDIKHIRDMDIDHIRKARNIKNIINMIESYANLKSIVREEFLHWAEKRNMLP